MSAGNQWQKTSKVGVPVDEKGKINVPYTDKEKLLLASLVDKYKDVVENKKTDATTIQRKKTEWDKIGIEYNSQATLINSPRTAAQLKKLWSNLKQRKRKVNTELKYQRLLTGGGPEPVETEDPVMDAVDVAAPYADVSLSCAWDSTAEFENAKFASTDNLIPDEQEPCSSVMVLRVETSEENITQHPVPLSNGSSSSSSGATLPSPMGGRKNVTSTLQTEATLRVKKMRLAIQQQEELHRIKMQNEEEQLKMTEALRKKAEAEHELALLKLKRFKESEQ